MWIEPYDLGPKIEMDDTLYFEVWDWDRLSSNDRIGDAKIEVSDALQIGQKIRIPIRDESGRFVHGFHNRRSELEVTLLKVPSTMPQPRKLADDEEGIVDRFNDLVEMGDEAIAILHGIQTSFPYRLAQLAIPFSLGWSIYGVYLTVTNMCLECDATALSTLNTIFSFLFIATFFYRLVGLLFIAAELIFSTVGKSWMVSKAESIDRMHVGFPIFTMIANQILKLDKSHIRVFLRIKRQRELDALERRKKVVEDKIKHLDLEIQKLL